MSNSPSVPVAANAAPAVPTAPSGVPAPKLNAIQRIEQELIGFFKQKEQAVANVHAIDGAIQAAQHLLNILRAEEQKAEAEAKKLIGEAEAEIGKVVATVEADAKKL